MILRLCEVLTKSKSLLTQFLIKWPRRSSLGLLKYHLPLRRRGWTFTNVPRHTTSLGARRAMSSRLGGWTSKSNKCDVERLDDELECLKMGTMLTSTLSQNLNPTLKFLQELKPRRLGRASKGDLNALSQGSSVANERCGCVSIYTQLLKTSHYNTFWTYPCKEPSKQYYN